MRSGRFVTLPSVGLAYQLHLHGGFVLRPSFLLINAPTRSTNWRSDLGGILPWVGLQAGWSF